MTEPSSTPDASLEASLDEAKSAAADQAQDQAQRDQFSKLMEKAGEEGLPKVEAPADEAKPEPKPRDGSGKFQSKKGEGSEDGEEPDGKSRTTALETDTEYEAALHALRRARYTTEQIDMLGDRDDVLKHADPIARMWADADRANTRAREAEKALEEATANRTEEGSEAAPQAPQETAPSSVDWDKEVAELSEALGEEDAKKLTGLVQRATESSTGEVAAMKASLESMQGLVFDLQMENVRRGAQGRIPDLADNENWQAVRAQLGKLNADSYQSIGDMVEDAARMLGLGGQADPGTRRRTSDLNKLKDAGRTASTTSAPPSAVSKEESSRAAWDKLMAGVDS